MGTILDDKERLMKRPENEHEWNDRIIKLLQKFRGGAELMKTSAMFDKAIMMMASGESVYSVLEQVIIQQEKLTKEFERYVLSDTRPIVINPNDEPNRT